MKPPFKRQILITRTLAKGYKSSSLFPKLNTGNFPESFPNESSHFQRFIKTLFYLSPPLLDLMTTENQPKTSEKANSSTTSIPENPVSEKIIPPSPRKINPAFVHYLSIFDTPVIPPAPVVDEVELEPTPTGPGSATSKPAASKPAPEPVYTGEALPADDVAAIDQLGKKYQELKAELGKVIIGQEEVIEKLAICLFARGHGLLMGVPGLAKTLLVSSIAETLHLDFNRIQFTPDLMPADISGTDIIQDNGDGGKRQFEFVKGPVFSNIVLADEINRAPAKTQSAMLEAMQERHVTVLGRTYKLDAPFFVLATQNPVEQEGTYPLPEAQLDRFMFLIDVDYPTAAEEKRIARETTGVDKAPLNPLLTGEEVLEFQSLVRRVPVPDHIYDYAVEIVRRTRPDSPDAPEWLKEYVGWGAGPRAVQYLILGCKARAALRGTYMASLEDIEAVASPVLSHRVLINFAAESQGMTAKKIVARLVEEMRDEV
jgi:MoxR-like ATPase